MVGTSNNKSMFLYNLKVYNFKILFEPSLNIQEADYNLFNKYIVYKVKQYQAMNIEDYSFWEFIQIDFMKFEA